MSAPGLASLIADTAVEIAAACHRRPPPGALPVLDPLFRTLAGGESARERAEAEDLIWALWYAHEDDHLERRMNKAIGLLARRELDSAHEMLDALVLDAPDWAEAWNKRATLHFLEDRDLESVHDIRRTVELEPRHFGAMSGYGEICLRAGDEESALVGFQAALAINPNLDSVRATLSMLEKKLRKTLH